MDLSPIFVASVVSATVSYLCCRVLSFDLYFDGIAKLLIDVVLYMGWSLVFKPEAFVYTQGVINPMMVRIINRKNKKLWLL